MIDVILKNYLEEQIEDTEIVFEQPANRPSIYVLIEKIDGGETNKIKASTFSIKTRALRQYDSAVLNEQIKDAMFGIIVLDEVSGIRQGGEYGRIDTSNKMYEYETIWNIYHY